MNGAVARLQRALCVLLAGTFLLGPGPWLPAAQARAKPLPVVPGLDLAPWLDVALPAGTATLTAPEIALPGPAPRPTLRWTSRPGAAGALGPGWATNLELRVLRRGPRTLSLSGPDGVRRFDARDGRYLSRRGEPAWLEERDGGFVLREGESLARFDDQGHLVAFGEGQDTVRVEREGARVLALRDDHGRSLTFSYADDLLSAVEDHGGRRWSFAYAEGRLVQSTTAAGQQVSYGYDDARRLNAVRSAGASLGLAYDAQGRVLRVTGTGVDERSYAYADGAVEVQGPAGWQRVRERATERGSLREVEDLSGTLRIERDARELPLRVETAAGTTRLRYDAVGHLVAAQGPQGQAVELSWDGERLAAIQGPDGAQRFVRDEAGRLREVHFPDGSQVALDYDARGRVQRFTDAAGVETAYAYDARGLLSAVRGPAEVALAYDPWCRLSRVERGGDVLRLGYDAADRIVERTDGVGERVRLRYDVSGNLLELIDARGVATAYRYDARGRLLGRTRAGAEVSFAYDAQGELARLEDPAGLTRAYVRDALGRVIAERDPSGVEHAYRYDGRGLLAEEQVAGDVTRHRYDAEGRLVASRTADGVETRFAYDAAGRVVEVQSPDQHLRLGYDAQDRVTSVEDVLARTTLGYAYDVRGLRSELRAPWGTTRYAYDDAGRLSELTDPAGGRYVYAYDAAGRLAERRFPNGARSVYAYDLSGRLLEVTVRDAEGAAVERCRYAYDAAGNRIEEETSAGLATFAYDDHDRLIAARYPDGRVEGYRYDATGNRVAQTLGGVEVEGAHQAQQLVAWGEEAYAYDARGGVIARETPAGTWRYAYDGRGRLARAVSPQGVETRYGYGPSGLRAWKEVGGERTRFVYDVEDVVGEVDAQGELVASYVHGLATDTPLAVEREGTRHYLHADGRLNVTALTDAAGRLAGRYRYAAFGETLAHEGAASPYRFGGRPLDAETGLYYHRARYYQPERGRYLTPDPAGAWGGLHAYAYVDHNPLTRVDPEGAWLNVVLGAGIGALVGGGLELATQLIENGGKLSEVRWGRVAAETAGGAVIGAATSVGAGALAGAVKGGRMAKNAGRLARAARRLKAPIARRFAGLGTKARGLVTKERLLGVAKWPLRFTWATAKGLPKKIADGTIYGIVNAVLGVLVYNRITAGTFNVLKTLRETVGDSGDEEAKPDSEQAKVIAIEARDKNLRAARDATHSRTGKVDWTVMAITGLQSRKEGLETQRLILRQSPPVDEAALARIDARIAQIDEQLVRYLDLMAWYYHQYDEIKGVTLRRMHEFGFTIERLQRGGRKGETVRVPEREDLDRNSELVGYAVGFEGREGRYLLSQQWPRTEAEAEAAAGGAAPTGDPLDGLIDPAQLPAGQR